MDHKRLAGAAYTKAVQGTNTLLSVDFDNNGSFESQILGSPGCYWRGSWPTCRRRANVRLVGLRQPSRPLTSHKGLGSPKARQ